MQLCLMLGSTVTDLCLAPGEQLNSVGLVMDIVGAGLLWKFGLSDDVSRDGSVLLALETDEEQKALGALYDRWSRVGLVLLIGGFVLQLISNFYN